MAESGGPDEGGKKSTAFWPDWMTPRRAYEFARNVVALESSVTRLRDETRDLRIQVLQLQQSVSEQNAQLKLLIDFVKESINEKVERRAAEQAEAVTLRILGAFFGESRATKDEP